ncbi:MAG TPA: hypothetical protein VFE47_25960 [Tepidisphaeraceae bacterium]|jgi:hypothetical protein|nr:hypothetical protein [Tepidisphaeraceae bacterium]
MEFDFNALSRLLKKNVDDREMLQLIGNRRIDREGSRGDLEFKEHGVALVFSEFDATIPPSEVDNPKGLYLSGIHFHRLNHEGYQGYIGSFPWDIGFGDSEPQIVERAGKAAKEGGGGGRSPILKRPIPRWLRYDFSGNALLLRFDLDGKLELVTLFVPQIRRT